MNDFREYAGVDFSQEFLIHYGVGHLQGGHSGRWPWGSGENGKGATHSAKDRYKSAKTNYRTAKRALRKAKETLTWTNNNGSSTATDKRNAKRDVTNKLKALNKAENELNSKKADYRSAKDNYKEEKKHKRAEKDLDRKEAKLKNITSEDLDKLSDEELQERINRIKKEDAYRQSIGQDSLSKQRKDKDIDASYDRHLTKKEEKLVNVSNKEISKMTDKELNDRINRLRQEDTYRQLIGQKTLSQLRRDKDLPKEIAKEAGVTLAKNGLNALVNKVIIPTATGHIIYTLAQGRRNAENAEVEKWNKEHPDDQRQLKADVDYVSTVFKDAKFLSTKDKDGGGKKNKGQGNDQQNQGGQQEGSKKGKKDQQNQDGKKVNLEDAKKVVKDMVDMSGAKDILDGAEKRLEKQKAKEQKKEKEKQEKQPDVWDTSYETAELSKKDQKAITQKVDKDKVLGRDTAKQLYGEYTFPVDNGQKKSDDKPKEKDYSPYSYGDREQWLKYDSTPATYTPAKSSKEKDDAVDRAVNEYRSQKYMTYDSTPSSYSLDNSYEERKSRDRAKNKAIDRGSTLYNDGGLHSYESTPATYEPSHNDKDRDRAINKASKEYRRQNNGSNDSSGSYLNFFDETPDRYDSTPATYTPAKLSKKEQNSFSSAVNLAIRSAGIQDYTIKDIGYLPVSSTKISGSNKSDRKIKLTLDNTSGGSDKTVTLDTDSVARMQSNLAQLAGLSDKQARQVAESIDTFSALLDKHKK